MGSRFGLILLFFFSIAGLYGVSTRHDSRSPFFLDEPSLGANRPNGPLAEKVAQIADELGEEKLDQDTVSECDGIDKNLSCACQASHILKKSCTGIAGSAGVIELVDQLRDVGWSDCSEPQPGAVAYSNPSLGTKSKRSHIGVIDRDLCVVHNSGGEGGKLVETPTVSAARCSSAGGAGAASFNIQWAKSVSFLCPPMSPPAGATCAI